MANLKETAQWEDGIYRIELTDPVVGGEDGIDNIQAKQLGNRTLYLKKKLEGMEGTVDGYAPDMQEALFAGLKLGLDLGALAMKEHEQTRLTRFQELRATVKNRGVKSGVTLSKSSTATRNISCSDGVVFMNGREYPVANQTNTASVASNTTEKSGVVIIYMFQTEAGIIDVAATTLNGPMPDGAIELARATVPAGNTEENARHGVRGAEPHTARRGLSGHAGNPVLRGRRASGRGSARARQAEKRLQADGERHGGRCGRASAGGPSGHIRRKICRWKRKAPLLWKVKIWISLSEAVLLQEKKKMQ